MAFRDARALQVIAARRHCTSARAPTVTSPALATATRCFHGAPARFQRPVRLHHRVCTGKVERCNIHTDQGTTFVRRFGIFRRGDAEKRKAVARAVRDDGGVREMQAEVSGFLPPNWSLPLLYFLGATHACIISYFAYERYWGEDDLTLNLGGATLPDNPELSEVENLAAQIVVIEEELAAAPDSIYLRHMRAQKKKKFHQLAMEQIATDPSARASLQQLLERDAVVEDQ